VQGEGKKGKKSFPCFTPTNRKKKGNRSRPKWEGEDSPGNTTKGLLVVVEGEKKKRLRDCSSLSPSSSEEEKGRGPIARGEEKVGTFFALYLLERRRKERRRGRSAATLLLYFLTIAITRGKIRRSRKGEKEELVCGRKGAFIGGIPSRREKEERGDLLFGTNNSITRKKGRFGSGRRKEGAGETKPVQPAGSRPPCRRGEREENR